VQETNRTAINNLFNSALLQEVLDMLSMFTELCVETKLSSNSSLRWILDFTRQLVEFGAAVPLLLSIVVAQNLIS
jgi:hypothetical protein